MTGSLSFDADDEAGYGAAMRALDQAREGGAVTLGMLTAPAASPSPGS